MKVPFTALALGATLLVASGTASAQFQKPEDAVKYRQSVMSVMASHFSRIGAMANGRVPFDAKTVQDNAALVETLSKLPWPAFGPESEKATNPNKAKPEIWKEQAKFKESADKMVAEVAKLNAASKTGNLDQIKAAFGGAAASCKACHDAFQKN